MNRLDTFLARISVREHRLIGIALMRIVIGFATILYCLADYDRREFLWGPTSYYSAGVARTALPHHGFSLFLLSDSRVWFEIVFHLVIVVSLAFMIFGGRSLTIAQAVLLWSLHWRNQDVLEGGDNLAQIVIIFMIFTVSNAYFAPGARNRRERMLAREAPVLRTAVHNLAAYLMVFQICVLYFMAGYWKVTGEQWQDGVAMYYISHVTGFALSSTYAALMSNAFIGTAVTYFTVFTELAFPFAVLSVRGWVRKTVILAIEGMHLGIMVFMGLVCFGLLMLGADSVCLRDDDYKTMYRYALRLRDATLARYRRRFTAPVPSAVVAMEEDTRVAA
ncbi:Sporulation-delaying protein sdpB [Actinoplanes sp. SE50]|uniref:HTTM domain-containing protein n=1 Tax=unclassified Actinoplanes TaxID=2626549 RepID=UPI00023EBDE7|nr:MULTISPECIES: HTTM domain-containing protein [unclassified Actinoplanes]AEV86901.1 Sporulation-delaying protein sdpB [Actinoplanes sp. SE50/110]ATO85298.1 Sporulation-delaying protein sdpB [Actinoplanes sp. SE50]SLM02708.1 Sporulation-delaying protein sdpB [Actinoplanes sp. SE50/110]